MNFLEKDLEEIIYTSQKNFLIERGLDSMYCNSKLLRQLKIGNYGIADLVQHRKPYYHDGYKDICKGEITVYELKQNKLSISAFLQAVGYLHGIKRYLNKRNLIDLYDYKIVLIGKDLDLDSTFVYLPNVITSISDFEYNQPLFSFDMYRYEYRYDGIYFKSVSGYSLINEGF